MQAEDVSLALDQTLIDRPTLLQDVALTKCDLADACYSFLNVLKGRTRNPIITIAIRAIHGAISRFKQNARCA